MPLPLEAPRGYGVVAVVHPAEPLGIGGSQALALLYKRTPRKSAEAAQAVTVIDGLKPRGNVALCRFPKSKCPEVVLDPRSDFFLPGAPLLYRAVRRGQAVLDLDEEALVDWALGQPTAIAYAGSPKQVRDFVALMKKQLADVLEESWSPKVRTVSRIGGAPAHNASGAKLPHSGYRYALHLGPDLFGTFFGDAGSFHVWLANRGKHAFWMGDSA